MQPGEPTRNGAQNTIAAALHLPTEGAGQSLADIVRRDLDAALQLLTDRAQYITGASGAAIALKRNGMNDMLCRASTGENAPELGALLSTEYGLSGESVRTRQALRCDDAERDERVNREVCRQLGIASVVVMPVVHDDEVLGVFELFSGKANAFGERDLSAVQRLTEMVQTAVRLANAAQQLPETLKAAQAPSETSFALAGEAITVEEDILEDQILEVEGVEVAIAAPLPQETVAAQATTPQLESVISAPVSETEPIPAIDPIPTPAPAVGAAPEAVVVTPAVVSSAIVSSAIIAEPAPPAVLVASEPKAPVVESAKGQPQTVATEFVTPKKKLFWSAALDLASEVKNGDPDQSHVPPVLRGLRKCEACGFPVSAGRTLCVECEEKKWRGQLRKPANGNAITSGKASLVEKGAGAAAAVAVPMAISATVPSSSVLAVNRDAAVKADVRVRASTPSSTEKASQVDVSPVHASWEQAGPELVLSAAAAPRQSWISAHKYILVAVLVAAAIVAIFLSR